MISRGSLILALVTMMTLNSYAQTVPSPTPLSDAEIDRVCNESMKKFGDPKYANDEKVVLCQQMEYGKQSASLSRTQGAIKIPVSAICIAATLFCYGVLTAAIGSALAPVCGISIAASSIGDEIGNSALNDKLKKEAQGVNYAGLATGAVSGIAGGFAAGAATAAGGASGLDCLTIAVPAAGVTAEVFMRYDQANTMDKTSSDARDGLRAVTNIPGSFNTDPFRIQGDQDANYKDDYADKMLDSYPPETLAKIEELTGMKMADVANYNGDPNALMEKMMANMGVPPEGIAQGMKEVKKIADANGYKAENLASANSSGLGFGTSSNDSLSIRGSAGTSSAAGNSGLAFRDPASMTADQIEKDRFHDIFLRVSQRYDKKKIKDLAALPWASKKNQFANKSKLQGRTPSSEKLRFN
ncbi:MAG: hypothetical protein KA715_14205 [Xanthomonadaceae bacterium]|nr:hypothetical protein [Xanthomonadaceae bacterium]